MSEWISVDDWLPGLVHTLEPDPLWSAPFVLAFNRGSYPSCDLAIAYYDTEESKWYDPEENWELTQVTHWMPLPDPPGGKHDT